MSVYLLAVDHDDGGVEPIAGYTTEEAANAAIEAIRDIRGHHRLRYLTGVITIPLDVPPVETVTWEVRRTWTFAAITDNPEPISKVTANEHRDVGVNLAPERYWYPRPDVLHGRADDGQPATMITVGGSGPTLADAEADADARIVELLARIRVGRAPS